MNFSPTDVTNWTRYHSDRMHPFWWGILGAIAIEITVITGFLMSYFYLWIVNSAENRMPWFPAGANKLPLLYPNINLFLLAVCAFTMWYGGIAIKKGKNILFIWLVVICCLASFLILYLRWLQFQEFPFTWKESAYASFIWLFTGFHFFHVSAAVVGTAVIGWLSYKGYYTKQRRLGVQIDTMYWYYVVFSWIPFYIVIYWLPRWVMK